MRLEFIPAQRPQVALAVPQSSLWLAPTVLSAGRDGLLLGPRTGSAKKASPAKIIALSLVSCLRDSHTKSFDGIEDVVC